jgi:hypothetical protein
MSIITSSYYAFGIAADRLILVRIRADGSVRVQERVFNRSWSDRDGVTQPYRTPKDPTQPIQITFTVDPSSFGIVSRSEGGWGGDNYQPDTTSLLGIVRPFGSDIDYENSIVGSAPTHRIAKFELKNFAAATGADDYRLKEIDALNPANPSFERIVFLNRCFAGPGEIPVYDLVLRLSGGNTGSVTVSNLTP